MHEGDIVAEKTQTRVHLHVLMVHLQENMAAGVMDRVAESIMLSERSTMAKLACQTS
jgi:hypothetical protein